MACKRSDCGDNGHRLVDRSQRADTESPRAMTKEVDILDIEKIKSFLESYLLYLRYTKKQSDSYRADAIEDVLKRL